MVLNYESSFINQGCNASAINIIPLILCKHQWDRHTKKGCIYVMNETTFPPKGKLPQFSSYLASYQIISRLKQGAEHKTFIYNFENFNSSDSYVNSTSWKKLLDNKLESHR